MNYLQLNFMAICDFMCVCGLTRGEAHAMSAHVSEILKKERRLSL